MLDSCRAEKGPLRLLPLQPGQGGCPEPYIREEVLGERVTAMLDWLRFDDEVLA